MQPARAPKNEALFFFVVQFGGVELTDALHLLAAK